MIEVNDINIQKWIELAIFYGIKLFWAIVIWIVGSWLIKKMMTASKNLMFKKNYDESLQIFLLNLFYWSVKIILIIVVLGTVGFETTSFAAIIGAAGLAIGLALQGSLGNFAGGVLIMIFKPFKIGDLIEAHGQVGVVKNIEIFTTKLTGPSNNEIIIPNGTLSNGTILNYSTEGIRRVDLVFHLSYSADIKKAKDVMLELLKSHPMILLTPEPSVNVLELSETSMKFAARPWCQAQDYWTVHFDITEQIKLALDDAHIELFHQNEVRF